MELIDKEALMEKLNIKEDCDDCDYHDGIFCKRYRSFVDACDAIAGAPVIKCSKGQWLVTYIPNKTGGDIVRYECDQCHHVKFMTTKFCPNCGAKMEE